MGSYFTYSPHQVFSGFGADFEFNAAQAWADWKACTASYQEAVHVGTQAISQDVCQRAVDAPRAALGRLGYGKLTMGVAWGPADQAAMKAFYKAHGLPEAGGLPTEAGLNRMQVELGKGAVPGPQTPVDYEEDQSGNLYAVAATSGAGVPITAALIAGGLALAVVGYGAIKRDRRRRR
jgi:hypothetical protein